MKVLGIAIITLLCIVPLDSFALTTVNLGKITTGTVLGVPMVIGIQLSSVCETLVKHGQTGDCPSYKDLIKYDTTNQMISGKFVTEKTGYFHRLVPHTINHYQMYPSGKPVIIVDPDPNAIYHGKLIEIVPHGFTYTFESVVSNHTRIEYHDRYVDPTCTTAKIDYSVYLLNDTISYLESGCKNTTFKEAKKIEMPIQPAYYNQSSWYKYKAWLDASKQSVKNQDCRIVKCDYKDPTRKW